MPETHCLVTGGAGYIGSHVARMLSATGRKVVILDNLSKGFRDATLGAPLVVGDMGDQELVSRTLREYKVDSVLHFAALTIVPESVADPLRYYDNNTSKARRLIECCVQAGVSNFVFSSTAAVYGIPDTEKAYEDAEKEARRKAEEAAREAQKAAAEALRKAADAVEKSAGDR